MTGFPESQHALFALPAVRSGISCLVTQATLPSNHSSEKRANRMPS